MELFKVLVPIIVALVSSTFVYFSSRSKIEAEINSLEKIQKSEIERLEKEQENEIERLEKQQNHELNRLHEEVKTQSELYENQSQTDLTSDILSSIVKDNPAMDDFFNDILQSEISKEMNKHNKK